jgi:catechol 2,3-dioxygenase-like lactoylglutathione lyase family enzyme
VVSSGDRSGAGDAGGEERSMGLGDSRISAQIAVSNLARARAFYEGKLGLVPAAGPVAGEGAIYPCGSGTSLYVYASADHAGKATATLARWDLEDLEGTVDELTARGVVFERYGEPVKTDPKGIHDSGYGKVAWVRDPDGNTFALEQIM